MKGFGGIGFASSPFAHFTFPISRDVCLLAGHEPRPATAVINSSKVRSVNKGTITRADSQLYAPFKSLTLQRTLDSVTEKRPPEKRILLKKGKLVEE